MQSQPRHIVNPSRHLLLVDDEPNIPRAIQRVLRREGYNVAIAHNAYQAIELMQHTQFGVVISDYRMPGMNGVEFLAQVRRDHPGTMRMMLSGEADLRALIDAVNDGHIYKFMTKPWRNDDLREEVRSAFAIAEQRNIDTQTGWLTRQGLQERMRSLTVAPERSLVVGEIANFSHSWNLLGDAEISLLAGRISNAFDRHLLLPLGTIASGMFAAVCDATCDLERICETLNTPLQLSRTSVSLDINFGVTDIRADTDFDELLNEAIIALTPKLNGQEQRDRVRRYSSERAAQLQLRHTLESDMNGALQKAGIYPQHTAPVCRRGLAPDRGRSAHPLGASDPRARVTRAIYRTC